MVLRQESQNALYPFIGKGFHFINIENTVINTAISGSAQRYWHLAQAD